jgi:23S rRNA A2030 N6-methylase RlmJ
VTSPGSQRDYVPLVANVYAANFGDVVKHALLCEAVLRERPSRYLESHGGRLAYDLVDLDPGPGGIWDFTELAAPELHDCAYARLVRPQVRSRDEPGRYPGSISLAASLLPATSEVIAYELVGDSADDLTAGLEAMGRRATVHVADGLSGVVAEAQPGDLVLLDPFHVHERRDGISAADVFAALAARNVGTILWYAIYDPADAGTMLPSLDAGTRRGWCCEVVGETSDGGLAGCGLLTAHLSPATEAAAESVVQTLARTLAVVRPGLRMA